MADIVQITNGLGTTQNPARAGVWLYDPANPDRGVFGSYQDSVKLDWSELGVATDVQVKFEGGAAGLDWQIYGGNNRNYASFTVPMNLLEPGKVIFTITGTDGRVVTKEVYVAPPDTNKIQEVLQKANPRLQVADPYVLSQVNAALSGKSSTIDKNLASQLVEGGRVNLQVAKDYYNVIYSNPKTGGLLKPGLKSVGSIVPPPLPDNLTTLYSKVDQLPFNIQEQIGATSVLSGGSSTVLSEPITRYNTPTTPNVSPTVGPTQPPPGGTSVNPTQPPSGTSGTGGGTTQTPVSGSGSSTGSSGGSTSGSGLPGYTGTIWATAGFSSPQEFAAAMQNWTSNGVLDPRLQGVITSYLGGYTGGTTPTGTQPITTPTTTPTGTQPITTPTGTQPTYTGPVWQTLGFASPQEFQQAMENWSRNGVLDPRLEGVSWITDRNSYNEATSGPLANLWWKQANIETPPALQAAVDTAMLPTLSRMFEGTQLPSWMFQQLAGLIDGTFSVDKMNQLEQVRNITNPISSHNEFLLAQRNGWLAVDQMEAIQNALNSLQRTGSQTGYQLQNLADQDLATQSVGKIQQAADAYQNKANWLSTQLQQQATTPTTTEAQDRLQELANERYGVDTSFQEMLKDIGSTQMQVGQYLHPQIGQLQQTAQSIPTAAALPQLDPETQQYLDQIKQAQMAEFDVMSRETQDQLLEQLWGRGVSRSTVAGDAAGRMLRDLGMVQQQILGQHAQRMIGVQQDVANRQLQALGLQGDLQTRAAQLSGMLEELGLSERGQRIQALTQGGALAEAMGRLGLAERGQTADIWTQMAQMQLADRSQSMQAMQMYGDTAAQQAALLQQMAQSQYGMQSDQRAQQAAILSQIFQQALSQGQLGITGAQATYGIGAQEREAQTQLTQQVINNLLQQQAQQSQLVQQGWQMGMSERQAQADIMRQLAEQYLQQGAQRESEFQSRAAFLQNLLGTQAGMATEQAQLQNEVYQRYLQMALANLAAQTELAVAGEQKSSGWSSILGAGLGFLGLLL